MAHNNLNITQFTAKYQPHNKKLEKKRLLFCHHLCDTLDNFISEEKIKLC